MRGRCASTRANAPVRQRYMAARPSRGSASRRRRSPPEHELERAQGGALDQQRGWPQRELAIYLEGRPHQEAIFVKRTASPSPSPYFLREFLLTCQISQPFSGVIRVLFRLERAASRAGAARGPACDHAVYARRSLRAAPIALRRWPCRRPARGRARAGSRPAPERAVERAGLGEAEEVGHVVHALPQIEQVAPRQLRAHLVH